MAQRTILAALLVLAVASIASGQTPAPSTPASADAKSPVKAHIFASASYLYNFNRPLSGTNGLRVFDFSDNTVKLDVVEFALEKIADKPGRFGFRIDFEAGWSIPKVEAAAGLFRNSTTGKAQNVDLQQAYITYVIPAGSGIRVDAGKFVTPLGLEVIEGWDGYNDNASRSLLFGFAIPFTHTGVKMSYAFTPRVSGALGVVQGWDNVEDNNTGKTVLGQMTFAATDAVTVTVNAVTGPEQRANNRDRRTVVDVIAIWKATERMTVGLNVDEGREAHATVTGGRAAWRGAALYVRHAFSPKLALAVRGEIFSDKDGARTGIRQQVTELTVTPEWRLSPHAILRGDLRVDRSTLPVFETRTAPKNVQPSASLHAVFVY